MIWVGDVSRREEKRKLSILAENVEGKRPIISSLSGIYEDNIKMILKQICEIT